MLFKKITQNDESFFKDFQSLLRRKRIKVDGVNFVLHL